ncbi:hypothetical protein VT84_04915 [Gemmata sp. SH-PL17]|uniref:hypothetical protein n=1 Tax=Gemmata sp. SH-PL17 TaxID=1630693 RepID=UPI0004B01AFD|nr:hypothetical protein [Gemmata sp. SH-PL17]AMV23731.1 hypothetical protein VT84_04915 [Gemmata sp. SH-PL17]
MTPDPVAKLAQFTPAASIDAAELLFAVGRASARTHWGWKVAVAGLVVSNIALGAILSFAPRSAPPAAPVPVVSPPEPAPAPPASAPAPTDEPWSYRTLRATDLERSPQMEPIANLVPGNEPLTARSGRRGDID